MNINKKLTREGQHETASELELIKSRESGKLMYNDALGHTMNIADEGYVNKTANAATANPVKNITLDFKEGSLGPKVSFTKVSGTDPYEFRDIIIPGELEISRGNNGGGIFNTVYDEGYNTAAPSGTTWNTKFVDANNTTWAPLGNIADRTFDTWRNAITTPSGSPTPPLYVGTYAIMKYSPIFSTYDGPSPFEKYWLVLFTEWGIGENNEYGFSYDRWEIFPAVEFDYKGVNNVNQVEPTEFDQISEGVALARGYDGPIYNSVEESWENAGTLAPTNTRWNSVFTDARAGYSGFNDLSNLESRVYTPFEFALNEAIGSNILYTPLIMHDLTTDLYWKFSFFEWANGMQPAGRIINYSITDYGTGYTDGTAIVLAATGGTGQDCDIKVDISGGTITNSYNLNGGFNYTSGDILTFSTGSETTPFTIQVEEVKRRGSFGYTRQVVPQSNSIKFADGSTMNTAANANASCNTYNAGLYNIFPWVIEPTLIQSCTKVINTGGMSPITSLTGYKVAGTYYLQNDNYVVEYLGTVIISSNNEIVPGSFLPWTHTGTVTSQADDILIDSNILSPFANGAIVWDNINSETIPVDLLNIIASATFPEFPEDPYQIDLYLVIASTATTEISGIISFESEILIPSEYTVTMENLLGGPMPPVTPITPETPVTGA